MRKEELYKGFDNIPTRRGRGGTYAYIRWQDVANRMNEVFGANWSSSVCSSEVIGKNVIVRVRVEVYDSETKRYFSQEGFGGAVNDDNQEAGNPYKSAYSKALKDACKRWGIGLYLDEGDEPSNRETPKESPLPPGYIGKETGVPPTVVMKPDNVSTGAIPAGMALPAGVEMKPQKEVPLDLPKAEETIQDTQFVPVPPPPPPAADKKPVSLKEDMPMSNKVPTVNVGEPDYISNVQKAALTAILSIKGVEYESLVREALGEKGIKKDTIPEIDQLTYQEAVFVVKHGSDKFRRK